MAEYFTIEGSRGNFDIKNYGGHDTRNADTLKVLQHAIESRNITKSL